MNRDLLLKFYDAGEELANAADDLFDCRSPEDIDRSEDPKWYRLHRAISAWEELDHDTGGMTVILSESDDIHEPKNEIDAFLDPSGGGMSDRRMS